MTWLSRELRPLLAVAAASLDEKGVLIDANAGFLRLLPAEAPAAIGTCVDWFFVQPGFASLVRAEAGADGEIHRGLMTLGDREGTIVSLRGRLWREDGEIRLLAEHDIQELARLNEIVLQLNHNYADTQLALTHSNHRLQQAGAALEARTAELEATLANVKRLEGLLPICMFCKKIRTADNDWQRLEQYLAEHTDAVLSHGLCPHCLAAQEKLLR